MMQKAWKVIETLAYGYSSESTQWQLSNEYQQGMDGFQKHSPRPCPLDESSLSIGRNKAIIAKKSLIKAVFWCLSDHHPSFQVATTIGLEGFPGVWDGHR